MARSFTRARGVAVLALAVCALLSLVAPGAALAQDAAAKVHLFTVVSVSDEIVVGLTEAEMPALARGNPVGVVADLLADGGRLIAWRYGPSRGEDGAIRQVAHYRVALFAGGTVRIELYRTEQEVVPPAE